LIGLATLAIVAATATVAKADGLPASSLDYGPSGVAAPSSPFRYVTLRAGNDTVLARTAQEGGQVMFTRRIPGRFTIPAVAYDGTTSGLAADEQTLVLIRPRARFPQRTTTLAIVDTPRLRAHIVTLRGDFSFDAISPDGRWAYLVHYHSPRNPVDYEVRAYDTAKRRLVPGPIVDPSEPDEQMGGIPLSRATSADGRWAFTLYDGKEPFVHALDTTGRTAVCVDLPQLIGIGLVRARLSLDGGGGTLSVINRGDPALLINTETFSVSQPPGPAARTTDDGDGSSWPWLGLAAIVAAGGLFFGLRRLRRGGTPAPAKP
jgi:hypothetical protein